MVEEMCIDKPKQPVVRLVKGYLIFTDELLGKGQFG